MPRGRRRSVMFPTEKPKKIVQDYAAVDQFGELPTRKRVAAETARQLGHDMTGWRKRPNDTAGRLNNYCAMCNRMMVVCTETPVGFTEMYGPALTEPCGKNGGESRVRTDMS